MTGPPGIPFRVIRDQRVVFLVGGGVNTVVGTLRFALFDGSRPAMAPAAGLSWW